MGSLPRQSRRVSHTRRGLQSRGVVTLRFPLPVREVLRARTLRERQTGSEDDLQPTLRRRQSEDSVGQVGLAEQRSSRRVDAGSNTRPRHLRVAGFLWLGHTVLQDLII